jgi:signal transduction histidine kinase
MEALSEVFSERFFMPHGHCYLWTPAMIWLQVVTNALIGLSYVGISATLALLIVRVRSIPFKPLYAAFGVFIISCGFTHFMDIWVIWQPRYWLDGGLRALTAVASLGTAAVLPLFLPHAVRLVDSVQRMRQQGVALETALNDVSSMYARARELDQLKTSFFANVSHELRTPLTLILTPVEELLSSTRLSADDRQQLLVVRRNARSLLAHVNNLLDLERLDAGRLEPEYRDIDLAELVRSAASNFDSLARERRIGLQVQVPAQLAAQVDIDKVSRILLNLLSNAFKFTPVGGAITVELGEQGAERVLLAVRDSGPGVAEAQRELIFDRFRQGRAPAPAGPGGSGLGLSIVREFTRLHRGEASVRRAPEGGALFEIDLPRKAPQGATVHRSAPAELLSEPPPPSTSSPSESAQPPDDPSRARVLVVEDNPDMRALLVRTLQGRYQVTCAEDGELGLASAARHRPDLIISDLMMPKLSGEELVHAVRASPGLEHVPILLLSAKAEHGLRARVLESGAQDYLVKPFSRDELLARVRNLVTIKRTHDLLQTEVEHRQADVEELSRDVVLKKRALEQALEDARGARQLAEHASRAKSDFLSLVSHELRTPIASIELQLDRLRRGVAGPLSAEQNDILTRIARSAARLLDLVESLLEFARVESGRVDVRRERVDLVKALREVVEELRPRAESKAVQLEFSSEQESLAIQTDPRLLRVIAVNLVDNAIKYTEQGRIDVRVELGARGPALRVVDTGIGIDASQQERIFQPFEQLEDVRSKRGPGVGLGLTLVRNIARAIGADVELQSARGSGSAFTVTLVASTGST